MESQLKLVTSAFGHKVYVDPADYIGRQIIQHGVYDRQTLALTHSILKCIQPHTILDIGANIGNHTLAYSQIAKQVYAFEPGTRAFSILKQNVEINNLHHVKLINAGLSLHNTAATLYVNTGGNLGNSSLEQKAVDANNLGEVVVLHRGDEYIKAHGIQGIDFMKVDVEGHELKVFNGLKQTIALHRPIIQMEWDNNSSDRDWLCNPEILAELFPQYAIHAMIWNSNSSYWLSKPLGLGRRIIVRLFTKKRRVLTPFDPQAHGVRVNDVLLVPKEKHAIIAPLLWL